MQKISGLGRGLSSLIPNKIQPDVLPADSQALVGEGQVLNVKVEQIKANPHQPRTDFNHDGLEELTNSIKEHGILQPLIVSKVDGGYELIAGERRLKAAQLLELPTVPVIVRAVAEQQKLELALVENLQRRDLNPIEEAVSYQRLIDEFNLTQEQAAQRVGKSRTAVTNALRLLSLPSEIQKGLMAGKINYSTARLIAGLPPQERLPFFEKVLKNDLTVRAAESQAHQVMVKRHVRRPKDAALGALEDELQQALGTKVSIKKTGEAGTIMIEFFSAEELSELLKKLGINSAEHSL